MSRRGAVGRVLVLGLPLLLAAAGGCTVLYQHLLVTYDDPPQRHGWQVTAEDFTVVSEQEHATVDTFRFRLRVEHPGIAPTDSFPWDRPLVYGEKSLAPRATLIEADTVVISTPDGAPLARALPHQGIWHEGLAKHGRLVHDLHGMRVVLPRAEDEFLLETTVRWRDRETGEVVAELPCRLVYLRVREKYLEPISR